MPSFTTSDIIALVAVVVSGIVSVATIISNVSINRTNIAAKRDEIAFAEQLKAFSTLVTQITEMEQQRIFIKSSYKVLKESNIKYYESVLFPHNKEKYEDLVAHVG